MRKNKNLFRLVLMSFFCFSSFSCHNSTSYDDDDESTENEVTSDDEMDSDYEDGTHSATVDYYNPKTGYSESYTLDVEVEDGEVNQINFPKGGHLDEDHISAEELDDYGNATVEGEDGKTYDVTIDD